MKKIIIVWTIILVCIVSGLTYFGIRVKENEIYELMEKEIVHQAKKYMNNVEIKPELNELRKIDVDELKDKGLDPKLESDCRGYVIISNTEDGYKYDPYIKCEKYMTKDYGN